MKKILPLICFVLASSYSIAQKKSELIAQVARLEDQLRAKESEIAEAKRNESSSLAKATEFEKQVTELKDANKALLTNLKNFAEVSSKNSENVEKALASLEEKEDQIAVVTDAFSKNDSLAIVLLTYAKGQFGDQAKMGVEEGELQLTMDRSLFFDEKGGVKPESETWLAKVAALAAIDPNQFLTLGVLTNTGEFEKADKEAFALGKLLQEKHQADPKQMLAKAQDGGFKEGVRFTLHPDYHKFYSMVKEKLKAKK
ncbi:hypothetical protein [Sediminicola luteus]|uniref:OmpA-like domain-containing protein n=1 Tax=Sediminicola luteus TaxID=319238 RepID=A0A2A4G7P3_9FLAO|nr:hypothetical protein [Sediminicola luteus]PCE64647.1 hypothetical protein B7P33_05595 [Sediminicola luteus]